MDARIAEQQTILRAVVGSTLHGMALEGTDDRDEMAICMEPPEYVLGTQHFETLVHRTQPEGVKSQPGDLDLVFHSLRKWCRLALKGNPTILLLLFVPKEQCIVYCEPWAGELHAHASAFISRSIAFPFLGYMTAQRQRLEGTRGQMRVHRSELVEKYGFDCKYAGHTLRLGYQGVELLTTGRLTFPIQQRDYLLAVRRGEIPLQEVLTKAGELEKEIRDLANTAPLPEHPNRAVVDDFLIWAYRSWWLNISVKGEHVSESLQE